MAFENNSGPGQLGKISECMPNYEEQAALVKKEVDAGLELQKALYRYSDVCSIYEFRNISSYAEMVGGLTLQQRGREIRYNELLINIEKNQ